MNMSYYVSDGFDSRLLDFMAVIKVLILLSFLIYISTLINQFLPMVMFFNVVPLLYAVITTIVIIGILVIPEYGALFTIGWTIASLVLAWVGLISIGALLLDLLPIVILVYEAL